MNGNMMQFVIRSCIHNDFLLNYVDRHLDQWDRYWNDYPETIGEVRRDHKSFKYTNCSTVMGSIFETQNAEGRIIGRKIDGSYVYTCIMGYIATQDVEGNGRYLHL